jgi:O-antigen/teichoic acid export membrane protein
VLALRIAGVALFFGLTLFLTNNFSDTDVGQYDFSRSILIFLGAVAVFGMHQSVLYYSGFLKTNEALSYLKVIYRKMLGLVVLIATIFILLALLMSEQAINGFFDKPVFDLIQKTVFALFFYAVTMLNIDVLRAVDRTYLSELFRNVFRYLPFFAGILFIYYNGSAELPIEVFLLNFVLLALASTAYLLFHFWGHRYDGELSVSSRSILKRSGPMAISAVVYMLMQSVDVILLGKYTDFSQVAFYAVAVKLTMLINLVLSSVNSVYAPAFSEFFTGGRMDELRDAIKKATRLIFLLTFPAIVLLFVIAGFVLELFGPEYTAAKTALYILLVGQVVNTFCGSAGVYMNMTGKQVVFQRILVVAFAANLLLNLVLIPRYGISGAAVATSFSMILWNLTTAWYIYQKDNVRTYLTIR